MLQVLGYRAVNEAGDVIDAAAWTVVEEEERSSVWHEFSGRFLAIWNRSIGKGRGPHVFYFGRGVLQGLLEWSELTGDSERERFSFLWEAGRFHHTDLHRLIEEHFNFPAPGRLTLSALGRILGFLSPPEAEEASNTLIQTPQSLFHTDPEPGVFHEAWKRDEQLRNNSVRHVEAFIELEAKILEWARRHLESDLEQTEWDDRVGSNDSWAEPYLRFLEEEKRLRDEDLLALQDLSLSERIERFRAIGPLTLLDTSLDEEGRFLYTFRIPPESALSKFREDDFLKLVPVGSWDLKSGFPVILARYDHGENRLSVLSRGGSLALTRRLAYSLEEDFTDWNTPKLVHAVHAVFSTGQRHPVARLLSGGWSMNQEPHKLLWIQDWQRTFEPASALNSSQRAALELPFRKRTALIEGPPGTGKTHLLGWIIIALIMEAHHSGRPLRIAVSALTHRAIDGVLRKVVDLVARHQIREFPARVLKWGRWREEEPDATEQAGPDYLVNPGVEALNDPEEIEQASYLVLGATGFGLYSLLQGETGKFPEAFDWIVFDEASQVLVPQALLSLVYGRGHFLFLGDVKQLPPVVLGDHAGSKQEKGASLPGTDRGCQAASAHHPACPGEASHSVLAHLLERYGVEHRIRLDETYRMNEELCAFPARMWYEGTLRASPRNAHSRVQLNPCLPQPVTRNPQLFKPPAQHDSNSLDAILDPEKPVALVLVNHGGCHQKSDLEAEVSAQLACRLMVNYGVNPDRLALISPHRAQNNATAIRLRNLLGSNTISLPVIDTVERLQGAERDVILFAITTSDPDHMMSEFLNNPNRFNVAITRARHKLIVVGSRAFFLAIPHDEEALRSNTCFKEFFQFCRRQGSLFVWEENG
jgi:hypothetical protein